MRREMTDVTLDIFESDWRRRWLVERAVEIISEASRRLPSRRRSTRESLGPHPSAIIWRSFRARDLDRDLLPLLSSGKVELLELRRIALQLVGAGTADGTRWARQYRSSARRP